MDLEALVAPVVEAAGLDLVDVELRREGKRRVLRVTVDREGGLDLDTIAEVSERVSRRLDVEGFDPGPYALEVSSPGVERPLRGPADFGRYVGQEVRVRTSEPVGGARVHRGRLIAAGEEVVTIATDDGERTVAYGNVAAARTVVDWDEALKRAKRSER
ncbi:MAG: ribosome maturation factor RimP [Actinomycetota bacterium]